MRRFLLCTDMDRTLIPNGTAPESIGARQMFSRLAKNEQATIVYVTGRHRKLIEQAIEQYELPQPDFAIADVGTTIYELKRGFWRQWDGWADEIDTDWKGMSSHELRTLLHDLPELKLQEQEKQNRHKLSYYLPLAADEQHTMKEIENRLKKAGIGANLIWSIDEQTEVGLLDILPASANKLHAINFFMQKHGFNYDNTVFAGDSGNDLDVLLSPIHAVLVANASEDVRAIAERSDLRANLYLAKGGYLGMNGNYSAGILEGIAYFLPYVDSWLRGNK